MTSTTARQPKLQRAFCVRGRDKGQRMNANHHINLGCLVADQVPETERAACAGNCLNKRSSRGICMCKNVPLKKTKTAKPSMMHRTGHRLSSKNHCCSFFKRLLSKSLRILDLQHRIILVILV